MTDRTWAWGLLVLFWIGSVALPPAASQQDASVPTVPKKEAWKWTLEERLAARFDPEALAAREAEHQAEQESIFRRFGDPLEGELKNMKGPPATAEHLDGRKAPELFLPGELFTQLINHGFSPQGGNWDVRRSREPIEERAAALGFGRDLWVRLEKVAAPYLELLRESGPRRVDQEISERDIRLCQLRTRVLEAAKVEFGEESFLRLLYEAVAPNALRVYILKGPDYRQHEEQLRSLEGGCP